MSNRNGAGGPAVSLQAADFSLNSENDRRHDNAGAGGAPSQLKGGGARKLAVGVRRSVRGGGRAGSGPSRSPFGRSAMAKRATSPTSVSSASTAASCGSSLASRSPSNKSEVLQQRQQPKAPTSPELAEPQTKQQQKKHRRRRSESRAAEQTAEELGSSSSGGATTVEDANVLLAAEKERQDSAALSAEAAKGGLLGLGTSSSWRSTVALTLFQVVLMGCAALWMTPSYAPPSSSSQAFFHTVSNGDPFSFGIEVQGWPEPQFQWRLNGVDIPGATDRRLHVPRADMSHSGTYTCVLENMAGRSVWEEGYVNVVEASPEEQASKRAAAHAVTSAEDNRSAAAAAASAGDSASVRNARMCLLKRAPEPVLRSASVDGGAAVIAAGEAAGYLDCFQGLKQVLNNAADDSKRAERQLRALSLLRSMHGSSTSRRTLVNAVSALNDLALAKLDNRPAAEVDELANTLAFEAGVWCASTPQCQGQARTRVVHLIMHALDVGEPLL